MKENEKIDLVILWVDGDDENWKKEKAEYGESEYGEDSTNARYRDWGLLKYWFRSVEKNIPWFNRIFFVTCGQHPVWLNLSCSKLRLVNHIEFMPNTDLPTFNSNAIEVNLHKIEDLQEQFILFNDDMYIVRPMVKEDFFENGVPCDEALLDALCPFGLVPNILSNNMAIINNHFCKKNIVRFNNKKWFNMVYGKGLYRNIALYPWKKFSGIYNQHLPIAYLKSTFYEVWSEECEKLLITSSNRFRANTDLSHWLFRYWRLVKGDFVPHKISGSFYTIGVDEHMDQSILKAITKPKKKMICINDSDEIENYEYIRERIIEAFEKKYPQKSSFEL